MAASIIKSSPPVKTPKLKKHRFAVLESIPSIFKPLHVSLAISKDCSVILYQEKKKKPCTGGMQMDIHVPKKRQK